MINYKGYFNYKVSLFFLYKIYKEGRKCNEEHSDKCNQKEYS